MLLEVKNLKVGFKTADGIVKAVNDISFNLNEGETLAIVGESGSGKSQSVFALLGLLAKNSMVEGKVLFEGKEILNLKAKEMNNLRSKKISIIFQDSMTSLNPYMKLADQLTEVLIVHKGMSYQKAFIESVHMLDAVKIPEAKKRMKMYPHELSGGMRQRVMIAMALLCKPKLLIADEPTTALDVTVQVQIMTLLKQLQKELGMAMILITHDLGVVAGFCDNVLVMYAGKVMEYANLEDIFYHPTHPYTLGLMKTIPRLDLKEKKLNLIPGNPPDLLNLPQGCPFAPRCSFAKEICLQTPILEQLHINKQRSCFAPIDLVLRSYQ
ncbi:oligopeptide ABC transporter ATP-binding protein OppD [Campylobacter sp. VicNov18]|uniref:oligopeptide/dipeptide ABC transporter ATP-binding protein n=1 Tax=Campylobacter bilis TaxID=2691918 RepID=UPI00130E9535|nr:oligopeptide/dipeptide ABC transporter ATP-binding protein [Campylobacter bilis]MPV64273.1 oligopeptide ABC transporter ATP-binding protein OppD [Campylobacter hepaticus]MBM0637779.1 oligopeptide ABC transporter ATP-binding protein OppD [Campylobacter bilis]MCC8278506.1 oligopeptide ABC transporter ATP-binding protein OppD [Campylobacter bilis]MCC8300009.1 oligopeptide ABC transporter ATP-binding protein OppD [Campylobacter bilis]MCC8301415.1 oligopeptide ABC transporter ATP-binding protein